METLAAAVWQIMEEHLPERRLLAYGGSNRGLVWWLPKAAWSLLLILWRKATNFVLVGDAATYALFYPILRLSRVRHATMVMGLDLTYANRLYRFMVHGAVRRAPQVIAISSATAEAARRIGVSNDAVCVVRPGIPVPEYTTAEKEEARRVLIDSMGLPPHSILVLSLGRLVRRKGVRWFVEHVLPATTPNTYLLVAGEGPERSAIASAAHNAGVDERVRMLGRVDDVLRDRLLLGSDLMVQANIRIPSDVEGFGLVIVEATLRGTPVIASDLEGIKDAIVDGVTGLMVPAESTDDWRRSVNELTTDRVALQELGERFRSKALDLYSVDRMGRDLLAAMEYS